MVKFGFSAADGNATIKRSLKKAKKSLALYILTYAIYREYVYI